MTTIDHMMSASMTTNPTTMAKAETSHGGMTIGSGRITMKVTSVDRSTRVGLITTTPKPRRRRDIKHQGAMEHEYLIYGTNHMDVPNGYTNSGYTGNLDNRNSTSSCVHTHRWSNILEVNASRLYNTRKKRMKNLR